ncbi:hypothetical protein VTK26DRAFT_1042 [Humicola hyalothermophila]
MADQAAGSLLSSEKPSDSGLQVVLHPLPLLEISDYITRAYQRGLTGAVVGALLGQQHGRQITIEHSFSCKSAKNADGNYELDEEWFKQRLDQMKLVHKSPMLDLVGWYALVPKTGPTALHVPIYRQILTFNESAVLLGLHIEDIVSPAAGDPLPITIHEANIEAEADQMEHDGPKEAEMVLRFRKLPYITDTGEAEMIAMQYVREGGANATADNNEKHILEQFDKKIAVDDGKGKRRAVAYDDSSKSKTGAAVTAEQPTNPDANLTRSEAEYMSALQSKYNAIKMMKSRLDLITAYLQRLPPDFTAGKLTSADAAAVARASNGQYTAPSNTIIRQIQALVTNAALVSPTTSAAIPPSTGSATTTTTTLLQADVQRETNDVHLISLLADLVSSVNEVRETGKKFAVFEQARHSRQAAGGGGGGGRRGDAAAALAGLADSALLGPAAEFVGGPGAGAGEF